MTDTSAVARRRNQQFSRRKVNLMRKADQLARLCQADLALIIRKNGRFYTYRSTAHESWPPPVTEIEKTYPLPVVLYPCDFEMYRKQTDKRNEFTLQPTRKEDGVDVEHQQGGEMIKTK